MPIVDPSIHILLIDDDVVDVLSIKRLFKQNAVENPLHIATNGFDALKMLEARENNKYVIPARCIILLDLNMPRMNGIEFLRVLRSNPDRDSLLVFILTSSNSDKDRVDTYHLNVAGYILKPMQFADFLETLSFSHEYWNFPQTNNRYALGYRR